MGKNSHQKNCSGISVLHSNPGCMWGVLDVLNYHHWHLKRRLLPNGKLGGGKHAKGNGSHANDKKVLSIDNIQQHNNAADEETTVDDTKLHATSSSKGSVKSRIKALISDELSRRKGRHRRSSTYPLRSPLARTDPMNHRKPSDDSPLVHLHLTDGSPGIAHDVKSSASESLAVLSRDHKFEECGTKSSGDHLEHIRVDGTGKQLIDNGSLVQGMGISDNRRQNLTYPKKININASSLHSKEIVDALDMINMNKEFLVKVLQDPSSPLFRHFHNQQTFSTKKGYSKSVSFPFVSSPKNGSGPSKFKQKQKEIELNGEEENLQAGGQTKLSDKSIQYIRSLSMPSIASASRANGILKLNNQAIDEVIKKKHSHNPMAMKHFMNLKQKIKHAIKEGKKEKHRISMDAILHKIPHGHEFSGVNTKDHRMFIGDINSPRSSCDSDHSLPSRGRIEKRCIRRTSSFGESLDRYCQLYESSVNRDGKLFKDLCSISDPKSMGRNLSLPDIKSYCHLSEYATLDAFPSIQVETAVDDSASNCDSSEQNSVEHTAASDHPLELDIVGHVKIEIPASLDNETFSYQPETTATSNFELDTTSKCDASEQKSVEHTTASDHPLELDTEGHVKSEIPANLDNETFSHQLEMTAASNFELDSKEGLIADDLGNLMMGHNAYDDLQDFLLPYQSTTEQTDQTIVPLHDSESHEDTTATSFSISDSEPSSWHLLPDQTDSLVSQLMESIIDRTVAAEDGVDRTEFPSRNLGHDILQCQVDGKNNFEYDYVKDILRLSGFTGDELLGTWHSDGQPMDPSLFQELEGCMLCDPDCSGYEEGGNCYHLMLFDLINEVLIEIYAKSYSYYPVPLCPLSQIGPMPVGEHVLVEVWEHIKWYLDSGPETDSVLHYAVNKDLAKSDRWMNLQFDTECVGLELEDLIFNDLLEETICT